MIDFKGSQFEQGIILWGVRWYVAYPIGYGQLEETMEERGVDVDHSSLNRWVLKYTPQLEKAFHRAIKRMTRPMLGFKSFWATAKTLAGIEMMHIIRKGQLLAREGDVTSPSQFYSLAA